VDKHSDPLWHFCRCNSDYQSLSGLQSRPLLLIYQTMSQSLVWDLHYFWHIRRCIWQEFWMLGGTQKGKTRPGVFNKNCQCSYCQAGNWWSHGILYLLGTLIITPTRIFIVFYWKSYVTEVLKAWKQDSDVQSDKVILWKMLMVN